MSDPRHELPRPGDHLVEPETDFEVIDGEVRQCLPANPPHSVQHTTVSSVLSAYKADGYLVDTDLLTRVAGDSNFASDCCVRKAALDPASGDRCLEELVVEIKDTQGATDLARRARLMARAGVRRILAIPVKGDQVGRQLAAGPLLEWQADQESWTRLPDDAVLHDRCLRRPLPAKALLSAVEADNAVAEAVLASDHPAVREHDRSVFRDGYRTGKDDGYRTGKDDGYRAGKDDGYRTGKDDGYRTGKGDGYRTGRVDGMRHLLLMQLAARGIAVDDDGRAHIEACADAEVLERWFTRIEGARDLRDVLGDA